MFENQRVQISRIFAWLSSRRKANNLMFPENSLDIFRLAIYCLFGKSVTVIVDRLEKKIGQTLVASSRQQSREVEA